MSSSQAQAKINSPRRGFTLVEALVSVAIFSIIMLLATGSVFMIVNANKKTHSLKSVMTNLNFALESMTREMRVGRGFACLGPSGSNYVPVLGDDYEDSYAENCSNGNVGFKFVSNKDFDSDGENDEIEYTFRETSGAGSIYREQLCAGCTTGAVRITATEIDIDDMLFYVTGVGSDDGLQPRVLVTITGKVDTGETSSNFDIQTFVSQRLLDY